MTPRLLAILLAFMPLVLAQNRPAGRAPDASTASSDLRIEAVGSYLGSLAGQGHLSGTVLIARGPELLLERSYGRANHQTGELNTPATLFAVASVTKPLTGIAARLVVADGRLSLEDPIAKWLTDFPSGSRITVAHLLGHRSGLPHRVTKPDDEQRPQTAESMTRLAAKASLAFDPGAQRLYSSAGYSVLARVLERATGTPYARLIQELVLAPALAASAVDATDRTPTANTRATGHFWTPDGPWPAPTKDLSFLVGAGSLWATPRDLFKVVRRIVSGEYRNAVSGARAQDGSIRWTGWSNGSQAFVDYSPATDVTIVFTGNLLTGASDWISRDLPRLLSGESIADPRAPSPKAVPLSADRRLALEGVYNYAGNEQRLTFLSSSVAMLGGEYLLLATGETTLFAPLNYGEYTVLADPAGAVVALQLLADPAIRMTRIAGK